MDIAQVFIVFDLLAFQVLEFIARSYYYYGRLLEMNEFILQVFTTNLQ